MTKTLKLINSIMFSLFICFTFIMLIANISTIKVSYLLLLLCIFPLIMVPYILDKIRVFHMDEKLIFIYYVFLIISLVLGSILEFYKKIWWYDLFSHFISGFITSIIAYILLKNNNSNNKWFNFMFIIIFTIAIAAIWEYFEFTIDLFGLNTQHVIETGINDTMEDMLIASLSGIISGLYYLVVVRKCRYEKG